MRIFSEKYSFLMVSSALVIATLAVYWPVHRCDFVRYDDDVYVTQNPVVQSGLSWQNIEWAFTAGQASNWHPVTWLSLMLDCTLFGVKARPMHLVSVALHIANTILLFTIFHRLTKRIWPSAFIAALFALHPLHVESVAWIAERKDVLSTLFWLLTMLAYIRYAGKPSAGRYVIALIFFALGLMSKPMLVTLPFVLILLDYWPLNRFLNSKFKVLNSVMEKLPFFFLAAISSIITYIVQQKTGAVALVPFKDRLANAIVSYVVYIEKLFVPVNLAVFYPHPVGFIPLSQVIVSAVILILLTAFMFYYGRQHKYLIFGWLLFLGTLVPVIGFVQVGAQGMADRYTYVPFIGLFIIIAFGSADLAQVINNKMIRFWILGLLSCVLCLVCVITTSIQLKYWQNSITLLEHTLSVIESDNVAIKTQADALIKNGRLEEAARLLTEKIGSHPVSPLVHGNLGNSFLDARKIDDAIVQYMIALKLNPGLSNARHNLALALAVKGDFDGAIEHYKIYSGPNAGLAELLQKALVVNPDSVVILTRLGYALAQSGRPAQALDYYYKALKLEPNNIFVHGCLVLALADMGKTDEAIEHCRIVLAARPNDVEMHNNLGIFLRAKDKLDEASESFKKAIQIDPNFKPARDNLDALPPKSR